jgi:hypothetical protein
MTDTPTKPVRAVRPAKSWIVQSKHHTKRIHQINVKLTEEANNTLREIADSENLRLYEAVEKVLAFYRQHHPLSDPAQEAAKSLSAG